MVKSKENALRKTVYYQVATLLEEGDYKAEYPLFNDWYIKWGRTESDNIWCKEIWLFNGEEHIDTCTPFCFCNTYAELAKGDIDCIQASTDEIVDKIFEMEG